MPDAQPRPPAKRRRTRRSSDHHIVVRARPNQPTNVRLLADALILHAAEQRAKAEGSPVPHLAGIHKLSSRTRQRVEGDDE